MERAVVCASVLQGYQAQDKTLATSKDSAGPGDNGSEKKPDF